jgi:hypothetical protein
MTVWLDAHLSPGSDAALREILTAKFREALALLASGENLVEIGSV